MGEKEFSNINSTINENIVNDTLIKNVTSKDLLLSDNNSNILFIGIIFILVILLKFQYLFSFFYLKKEKSQALWLVIA